MIPGLTVSVIIVSRGRPDQLCRTLMAVSQQRYPAFEVVVVADEAGLAAAQTLEFADSLKLVPQDAPNIAVARNAGIAAAAGEIVAFVDDDAVPEPSWLRHLTAGFAEPRVMAAGGFVRGRNGISFQWRARSVDSSGHAEELDVDPERISILSPAEGRAIKTEGTNMALRRNWIADAGGFDPGFSYLLDETDVNIRLARDGADTAIAPLAEVHHGYAPSPRRRADRVPRDLFEHGASWAVFWRKHSTSEAQPGLWQACQRSERRRLIRHMVAGRLEPRDVRRLMTRLQAGYAEGMDRPLAPLPRLPRSAVGFRPMAPPPDGAVSRVITGRIWSRKRLRDTAAAAVRDGDIVTLILLSPTAVFHRLRFDPKGFWEQSGGLFGRSERSERLFRLTTFRRRVAKERARVAMQRLLGDETA